MFYKLIRLFCTFGLVLTLTTVFSSPVAASTSQPSAPLGVRQPAAVTQTLVRLTSPVQRGANATIVVRSKAGLACSITVYYKSGPSKAKGLEPKIADSAGRCIWTWKVGTNTTPGSWQIVVKTGPVTKTYYFIVSS